MENRKKRSLAMDGIRECICDLLLDEPDSSLIPHMLEALRQWRDEERAESKQQCDRREINMGVLS